MLLQKSQGVRKRGYHSNQERMHLSALDKLHNPSFHPSLDQDVPVPNWEETNFYSPSSQWCWWINQLAYLHCVVVTAYLLWGRKTHCQVLHHLISKAEMSSSSLLPLGWALTNPSLGVLMLWPIKISPHAKTHHLLQTHLLPNHLHQNTSHGPQPPPPAII